MTNPGFLLAEFHGDLIKNILCFLAEHYYPDNIEELAQRLIYIEPSNRDWAVGYNPLEAGDQPFSAVLELMEIFKKFWGNTTYWGPRMDELLRNTLIILCENNLTMLEIQPFLTHKGFRQRLLEHVSNEDVRDYFLYHYNTLSQGMEKMYAGPILNRTSRFLMDPSISLILGQQENTINFRDAMDSGQWILLNLGKGQQKENLRILGTIFLTKINQAAQSRIDIDEDERRPFFLFIDEIQHLDFLSHDAEEILSQARKFGISLCASHQHLEQLPRELRSAFLGNAGTQIFFRLSHRDASQISSEMDQKERHLIERKLIDLKTREAYLKIKGKRPMLLQTPYVDSIKVPDEVIEEIKTASFRNWAKPVNEVKEEIAARRRLWMHDETVVGSNFQEDTFESLKDDETVMPDHSVQEGQNEW